MKNFLIKLSALIPVVILYPLPAFAAGCFETFNNGKKLGDLFVYISCTINSTIIPMIFSVAILMFVWGVVQFVINDSEEAKTKGRNFMIWGIIGLTVMIGVWGLVRIVGSTFGLNTRVIPEVSPNASQGP